MNQEQITDGITITFDGRDSVHIDMWAIQVLNFGVIFFQANSCALSALIITNSLSFDCYAFIITHKNDKINKISKI